MAVYGGHDLVASVAFSACDGARTDDQEPAIALAVAATPSDVTCLRATVTGASRQASKSVDATPGQPLVATLSGLPTGPVKVLLEGFSVACSGVTIASEPTWLSDVLSVNLTRGVPLAIKVSMRESGRINLDVDFVKDGAVDASADVAPMRKGNGTSCTFGGDCLSNFCVDGVCCNSACQGDCTSCNSPVAPGVCSAVPAGSCLDKKPIGASCVGGSNCASNFCVDGVCCNSACQGTCSACNSPGSPGMCVPAPTGKVCGSQACIGQSATGQSVCNGAGTCVSSMPVSCSPFVCADGACKLSCATTSDCAAGNFCAGDGVCKVKLATGAARVAGSQCSSGQCLNGKCF